jgi:hypothetical protein
MIESISSWSRSCLTMQGYESLGDEERKALWLGLRFAPMLCLAGIATGTALGSPALLLALASTALLGGFVLANHPFDYVYKHRRPTLLAGPNVPPSPAPPTLRVPDGDGMGHRDRDRVHGGRGGGCLDPRGASAPGRGNRQHDQLVPALVHLRAASRATGAKPAH